LCFNEEKIIEFTINAYRRLFPNCKVIIYDNESTDNSVEKARALNCEVRSFSTGGKLDEPKMTEMRNTVWKDATTPWIIMCDMDEIVAVNQSDLIEEDKRGTTILKTSGYEMYGKSEKDDLSNIKINAITSGEKSAEYSKTLCFRQDKIENINFSVGAHQSKPVAKAGSEVKFSEKVYTLYHFKKLGKSYYHYTQKRATPRAVEMKKLGMSVHYSENEKGNENAVRINTTKAIEEVLPLSTYYMQQ
jgi:glycosyltransferase involved in cell wall biosynthesis